MELIATDLDGTLIPTGAAEPSPRTAAALGLAERLGVTVVIATARPVRWMDGFLRHIGRTGLVVVSNGAATVDPITGKIVHQDGLAREPGLALVRDIEQRAPGACFAIECAGGLRLDQRFVEEHPYPPSTPRGDLRDVWDEDALKLLVQHEPTTGQAWDGLRQQIIAAVEGRATCTWSSTGLVEISAPGVTKASALDRICRDRGVPPDDVVAFGDMPNDVPMLEWAGRSYAVEGAHADAVRAATHRAPACHDDGVAQIIEQLLAPRT